MPKVLNRRTRVFIAPLVALVALLGPSRLCAQCQIQPEIVRSTSELTTAQKDAIRVFVECATPGLSAPEPLKINQSRAMIVDALRDAQASVPFRIELSKQLEPILSTLVADPRDIVVINALVIAGELATDHALGLAEKLLKSPDPAIRYAAVHAITLTLEAVVRAAPAVRDDALNRSISTLGKQLSTEQAPWVTDALARALASAIDIDRTELASVRTRAVSELSSRLGARLKAGAGKPLDAMLLETVVNCGTSIRNALAANVAGQARLPDQTVADACALAGDILAAISRLVRDKGELAPIAAGDTEEEAAAKRAARVVPSQAVALAETIITLSGVKSPVLDNPTQRLSDMLKTAKPKDDAAFRDAVLQLIGPDGAVIKQKAFKPDRFLP